MLFSSNTFMHQLNTKIRAVDKIAILKAVATGFSSFQAAHIMNAYISNTTASELSMYERQSLCMNIFDFI